MKKLTILFGFLIILFSFVAIVINSNKGTNKLISPLLNNERVLGINQWLPEVLGSQENAPFISAKAGLFIDTKTGQILYSKNPSQRLPIASLVKIMTVLIALEYKSMDDSFVISQRASDMEPDKMLLIAGEKLTLKELLDGIFLISANDGAEALAEGSTGGGREEFIKLMNDKAKQLGMLDTFYANPTGLDEDVNNSYSTAYDQAILTRYLIRNYPQTIDISKQVHVYLPPTENHQDYDMYSGINLLATYPGVVGFKTGYTPEAGFTLVTLARKDGHEVAGVLLGSGARRDEARELLDYSFAKLH